ncbi:2,5-diketo-D-gluconate reductase B [Raoultella sp. BIGb0138]|uniref:aldo/keto reductase n=1 Tax=Raoultella sp. BIGb0138 TaxID=2485115 RepID=UPI0010511DC4|nr:aldo/keto reductase [Raoultella sp. BIGb0138]TCW17710.1 2,5-diketo-D-gluconate reductase B [Raoultella sp. BIGb0138]
MNILYRPAFIRGFGTYKLRGERLITALESALNVGYRAIDTAQMYENEQEIGHVLRHHPVARGELCITTKVLPANYPGDRFMVSLAQSLAALNVEQVDVLLLHSPPKQDFSATLRLLEQAQRQGLARFIGLSNFSAEQMLRARDAIATPLVVNQVEFHPLLDQRDLLQAAVATQIPLSSYCSIARGEALKYGIIQQLAEYYARTPAQIILRWILQSGLQSNTMSSDPQRIAENFAILDFTLSHIHMQQIAELKSANFRVVAL